MGRAGRGGGAEVSGAWMVAAVFAASTACTAALILKRPYLKIRAFRRRLRVETFFLGALLGPVLILGSGLLPLSAAWSDLGGTADLQPLGILALFLSMVFISIFLDVTGVFEFCARAALRWAGGDGRRLFCAIYATVSALTVFTSNDVVVLTFTPLVYYFAKHARLNPVPYLMAEFFAANTWSMVLYVGNPTNIVLAGAFHLSFMGYAAWMLLPTAAAGAANYFVLRWLFRKEIDRPLAHRATGAPREAITDGPGALLGLVLLAGCVVALAAAPKMGIATWAIALWAALGLLGVLVARRSWARLLGKDLAKHGGPGVRRTLGRMPWGMAPFVLSLFVTVSALHRYGITPALGRAAAEGPVDSAAGLVWLFGVGSALAANVLNNIPMTLAFADVIGELGPEATMPAAFATTVGANLGANLTPLGALAGIMWMSLLRQKGVALRFMDFVRWGLVATPPSLAAALGVLSLEFVWFG